jgi:hypothetical protein
MEEGESRLERERFVTIQPKGTNVQKAKHSPADGGDQTTNKTNKQEFHRDTWQRELVLFRVEVLVVSEIKTIRM